MRHIGLGDDNRTRRNKVCDRPEKFYQQMGFLKMDAGCSGGFPHKPYRVETNIIRPLFKVIQQHIDHGQQYAGICKIQVNLISAESGPDMFDLTIR